MIIGIDNGLDGGLTAISKTTGAVINKTVMPTLKTRERLILIDCTNPQGLAAVLL